MKNVLKVFGIIVFSAVMGFSFAACATDTGGGGTPEELAAEGLAAELNDILEGCAVVNGTTVKLIGNSDEWLSVNRNLTVPEGVTLDVTEEGAEILLGRTTPNTLNVTLTVNGTIIAKSDHVQFEDHQQKVTINGSGTIQLEGEGPLISSAEVWWKDEPRHLTLDGVTLLGTEDNHNELVRVGKGGELVMKSGAIKNNGGYGVIVAEGGVGKEEAVIGGGTFVMEGGIISGNGGGVRILNGELGKGTFTMNSPALAGASGNISGNTREGGAHNVYNDGGTVNGSANPNPENITNELVW